MDNDDVKIIEKKTLYHGHLTLDEIQLQHKKFHGGWTDPIKREVIQRVHAVGVLPYDPVRDEVVLIRQFRIGVWAAQQNPWLVETVAGLVEENETPEDVACRESIEEAGCVLTELHHICDYYSSPGMLRERVSMYCGRTDTTNAGGIHGLQVEDEDIEAIAIPWEAMQQKINDKKCLDAKIIFAMNWLANERECLRKRFTA